MALRGHAEPRVQALHQRLRVPHVLQVPEGAEVQDFHGLGDVLHLERSLMGLITVINGVHHGH